jgi:hypothetical protein
LFVCVRVQVWSKKEKETLYSSKAFHVENPVGSNVFRGVFSNIENFV